MLYCCCTDCNKAVNSCSGVDGMSKQDSARRDAADAAADVRPPPIEDDPPPTLRRVDVFVELSWEEGGGSMVLKVG